jgi:hypothetical protein
LRRDREQHAIISLDQTAWTLADGAMGKESVLYRAEQKGLGEKRAATAGKRANIVGEEGHMRIQLSPPNSMGF